MVLNFHKLFNFWNDFLTISVDIPDDDLRVKSGKVEGQIATNSASSPSYEDNLTGNILQEKRKRLKTNFWFRELH